MERDNLQKWRLLTTGFLNAFENMAIDEAILKACAEGKSLPTLRFYGWKPHTVSIGYSQRLEETIDIESCERLQIDIVRRATGGRAVLHDEELTYSLVSPSNNTLFPSSILGTYKRISPCLIGGFKKLHINAQLVLSKESKGGFLGRGVNPSCFLAPSWYEIMVSGRKICGSAQRRVEGAFLQHGSILIGFDALKLFEALVFKGVGRKEVVDCLNGNVTSVNKELGKSAGFFELQEIFIDAFQQGLEIELSKGCLSLYEQQLKRRFLVKNHKNIKA